MKVVGVKKNSLVKYRDTLVRFSKVCSLSHAYVYTSRDGFKYSKTPTKVLTKELFVERRGYFRPVHTMSTNPPYSERKKIGNDTLIRHVRNYIDKPFSEVQMLVLDEIFEKTRLNTLHDLVNAGIVPANVRIPNPSPRTTDMVARSGAVAFLGKMGDMLRDPLASPDRLDVVYADFCKTWHTQYQEVKALFDHHERLLADKVLLHITTCRRAEKRPDVLDDLIRWARESSYGHVRKITSRLHNTKMTSHCVLLIRFIPGKSC